MWVFLTTALVLASIVLCPDSSRRFLTFQFSYFRAFLPPVHFHKAASVIVWKRISGSVLLGQKLFSGFSVRNTASARPSNLTLLPHICSSLDTMTICHLLEHTSYSLPTLGLFTCWSSSWTALSSLCTAGPFSLKLHITVQMSPVQRGFYPSLTQHQ